MHLRKIFVEYPGVTTAISVVLLLLALGVVGLQLWSRSQSPAPPEFPDKSGHDPDMAQPHAQVQSACGAAAAGTG